MEAGMLLKDLKIIVKATKPFVDIGREQFCRIVLFFDKEEQKVTAYSCNGIMMSVEVADLLIIDESFTAQIGFDVPYGTEEDTVYITKTEAPLSNAIVNLTTPQSSVNYIQFEGNPFEFEKVIPDIKEEGRVHIGVRAGLMKKVLRSIKDDELILLEFNKDNGKEPVMFRLDGEKARLLLPVELNEEEVTYKFYNK